MYRSNRTYTQRVRDRSMLSYATPSWIRPFRWAMKGTVLAAYVGPDFGSEYGTCNMPIYLGTTRTKYSLDLPLTTESIRALSQAFEEESRAPGSD